MTITGAIIYFFVIATAACIGVLTGYYLEDRIRKDEKPMLGHVTVKMELTDEDLETIAEKLREEEKGQE